MKIFQLGILFNNFVEIYIGYKLEFISAKRILELCERKMIIKLDNFKIEELKTEYKKSLFCFVDKIFYFCKKEDNFLPNEEDYNDSLFEIPDKYFRIEELIDNLKKYINDELFYFIEKQKNK